MLEEGDADPTAVVIEPADLVVDHRDAAPGQRLLDLVQAAAAIEVREVLVVAADRERAQPAAQGAGAVGGLVDVVGAGVDPVAAGEDDVGAGGVGQRGGAGGAGGAGVGVALQIGHEDDAERRPGRVGRPDDAADVVVAEPERVLLDRDPDRRVHQGVEPGRRRHADVGVLEQPADRVDDRDPRHHHRRRAQRDQRQVGGERRAGEVDDVEAAGLDHVEPARLVVQGVEPPQRPDPVERAVLAVADEVGDHQPDHDLDRRRPRRRPRPAVAAHRRQPAGDAHHARARAQVAQRLTQPAPQVQPARHQQREPGGEQLFYLSWCHGPAGTARLYHRLAEVTGDTSWRAMLPRLAQGIVDSGVPDQHPDRSGYWNNISQCCGASGVAEFFIAMHAMTGDTRHLTFARRVMDDVVSRATADGAGLKWIQAEHRVRPELLVAQTGLMQGAAGVGLALLHLDGAMNRRAPLVALPDAPQWV